jgi:DNA replication licensing factor MCM4
VDLILQPSFLPPHSAPGNIFSSSPTFHCITNSFPLIIHSASQNTFARPPLPHLLDDLAAAPVGINPMEEDDGILGDDDLQNLQALPETRIWGTEINVQTCVNVFSAFIDNYGRSVSEPTPFYHKLLAGMRRKNELLLNINCSHLHEYPPTRSFYHQLIQYPQEIIIVLDQVVNAKYQEVNGEEPPARLQVRTYGLTDHARLRSLNPENIEQLLCVKGMVIRSSSIIPDLKQAYFRCSVCNHGLDVAIERGRIEEPSSCPSCQTLASLEIMHNR